MKMMVEPSKPESFLFELYKLYVETAEKVSGRRSVVNTWMLSANSALVVLYAFIEKGKEVIPQSGRQIRLIAIPVTGLIICLAWFSLLVSYRKLNTAKFTIIQEMEKDLPFPLFSREEHLLRESNRWNHSNIESWIPIAFGALYVFLGLSILL